MRASLLCRIASPALLVLPMAGAMGAQETPPTTFEETLEVAVREVDVVVVDRDGRPVVGLGRSDFELLENGRPVEIVNFAAYADPPAGTVEISAPAATPPAPPEGIAEPPSPSRTAPPPVTWVIYVDQAQLAPKWRNQVLRQVEEFLARDPRPGDRTLLATFDGIALRQLSALGEDRAALDAALAQLAKSTPPSVHREAERRNAFHEILSAPDGMEVRESLLQMIEVQAEREAANAHRALGALQDLLAIVAGVDGRVALLLAGGGFSTAPADALYATFESRFGVETSLERRYQDPRIQRLHRDYQRLLETINAGRVTVYSIYAGDGRGPAVDADDGGGFGGVTPAAHATPEGSSSLAAFATATGGRAFVGAPDLAERLTRARMDLTHYYSLGYPASGAPGTPRKIEVRVLRPGLRVLHRQQLADRSPDVFAGDAAVSALLGGSDDAFGTTLVVGEPKGGRRSQRVPVEVRVPIASVTLVPDGEIYRGKLLIHFALRASDGGFQRLEPRPIAFEVPRERITEAVTQHVTLVVEIAAERKARELAVSVLDETSGIVGAVTAELAAGEP